MVGVLALSCAGCVVSADAAADWPHWRGPHDNGGLDGTNYPVKWSATNGLAWTTPLPGKGCSTPVVGYERIFLTAASQGQNAVLAFDLAGQQLWIKQLGKETPGKNKNGSGSNPSPSTDGQGLFVHFKSGDLAAFDLEGHARWTTNLAEGFGKDTLFWDFGSTPTLTAKDVVVALLRNGQSWVVAFDKLTGALHWKVARQYATPVEGDHSYASPLTIQQQGKEAILVWGATHLTAHDPTDGRTLWDCGDFNPEGRSYWPAVASPVIAGDIAVVPYGRGEALHGIRLGGSGDVTATHRLWKRKDIGAFVPTPAASGGRVYVLRDEGQIVCVSPTDGNVIWQGALPHNANNYYASPLVLSGQVYAAREDGVVFVVRAEGPFEVLAENHFNDRLIASPVPLGGRLILRGEKQLYCVDGR